MSKTQINWIKKLAKRYPAPLAVTSGLAYRSLFELQEKGYVMFHYSNAVTAHFLISFVDPEYRRKDPFKKLKGEITVSLTQKGLDSFRYFTSTHPSTAPIA
jgi:hypothetical protein